MLFFFACLSKHVTYITLNAAPLLTVQVRYISNLEQKWYRGLLSSLSFTPPPRADFFFNFQTWFQKHLWKHISSSVLFFLNSNFGAYCSYILPQLKTAIAVIFFPCCHLFFSPTHAWSERVPTWPPTSRHSYTKRLIIEQDTLIHTFGGESRVLADCLSAFSLALFLLTLHPSASTF